MKGRTIEDAALVMTEMDTVATALTDLNAGRTFQVDGGTVTLTDDVEFGHKFALRSLDSGDQIVKYGEVIGRATEPIDAGEWVHTHNAESVRAQPDDGDGPERPRSGGGAA